MDEAVRRFDLLPRGCRVLCALSGGADSVCLTHLLASNAEKWGITVAAAHFSHGIRPESADSERRLCQNLCDRLGIPLVCGAGDTPAYAAQHRLGLEEAARILRRQFLQETARAGQFDRIATGHHLEDSAETLLFNLIRGAGQKGLQGILPRDGPLVRPLILHSKEEILAYMAQNRLEYADDPTNFTGDNARALLRRRVWPALRELNGQAVSHLAQTALDNWLADEHIRMDVDELTYDLHEEDGQLSIPIAALLAASPEAAARALQTMQRKAGGRMLERPHIRAILELCRGSDPSARADLPGSRALRRYDLLVLTTRRPSAPEPVELALHIPVDFGPWQLLLTDDPAQAGLELWLKAEELPLTVRSRQPGDGIFLGFGTKTVKKLLMERKIPKDLRDNIPIVCHNKEILAIGTICAAKREQTGASCRLVCRRKTL